MEAKLMNTALKQANFQIPEDLLNELRATVGKGELSKFVSHALKRNSSVCDSRQL